MSQIQRMPNVDVYRSSRLGADQVIELGADHVAIATGATWRRDGCGRRLTSPVPGSDAAHVLTPDDILEGRRPPGRKVLLFDDDHYYMASVLAELLSTEGYEVSLATPMAAVAAWLIHTLEHEANQERLHGAGVDLLANATLLAVETGQALLHDGLHRRDVTLPVDGVVMVTARLPEDGLYHEVVQALDGSSDTGIHTLRRVGDCQAPGIIATAVYEGHRYARELGTDVDPGDVPFRRELHVIEPAMTSSP